MASANSADALRCSWPEGLAATARAGELDRVLAIQSRGASRPARARASGGLVRPHPRRVAGSAMVTASMSPIRARQFPRRGGAERCDETGDRRKVIAATGAVVSAPLLAGRSRSLVGVLRVRPDTGRHSRRCEAHRLVRQPRHVAVAPLCIRARHRSARCRRPGACPAPRVSSSARRNRATG